MGAIIASATESTESGNIKYLQKEVSGKDEQIKIKQPQIYFCSLDELSRQDWFLKFF